MVPDTNILVDRLESMKELANSGDWSIRVPIMVVIELEHLAEVQGCGQVLDCGGGGPVKGVDICTTNLNIFVMSRIWSTVRN